MQPETPSVITVKFPPETSRFVPIHEIRVGSMFIVDRISKGLYYKGYYCIVRIDSHGEWIDTPNFKINHLSWMCREVSVDITVVEEK